MTAKGAPIVIYALYLASVLGGVLALVGVIVAYSLRGEAEGLRLAHIEHQIKLFWVIAAWALGLYLVLRITAMLMPALAIAPVAGLVIVALVMAVQSGIGLSRLLDDLEP